MTQVHRDFVFGVCVVVCVGFSGFMDASQRTSRLFSLFVSLIKEILILLGFPLPVNAAPMAKILAIP